jgi:signal transduction histidine kinase
MDPQEANIYLAVIIAVVLMAFIFSYFAFLLIKQQRRNLELQKTAAFAEITSMEKERARIAADLHDDLGPILSTIKFRVDNGVELNKASNQLDEVIVRLREIAHDLLPAILQRNGPIAAIEDFIHRLEPLDELKIDLEYPTSIFIEEDKGIQLYRIVLEAINNCMKYANATKMQIIFREKNDLLQLICQDNGVGMDSLNQFQQYAGRGLISIKNRTELMGGKLSIESEKGKGTILMVTIPVK